MSYFEIANKSVNVVKELSFCIVASNLPVFTVIPKYLISGICVRLNAYRKIWHFTSGMAG